MCASEDSDQDAHLRNLIRVVDGRPMGSCSQGFSVSSGGKLKLIRLHFTPFYAFLRIFTQFLHILRILSHFRFISGLYNALETLVGILGKFTAIPEIMIRDDARLVFLQNQYQQPRTEDGPTLNAGLEAM